MQRAGMQLPLDRTALAAYTTTIFFSAFLLFSVQPMFAKMVLPALGGAPAVWAVSMCFFQALLLLGYAYAHLVSRHLPPRPALVSHLAVAAAALLTLPIALPVSWAQASADNLYWQLIAILGVGVGLPFFALAANAPLLQAWFVRSGHAHQSADVYSLYAASNAGSLAALLAYPVLIEPLVPLGYQGRAWAIGFVLLGLMLAACGWLMLSASGARGQPAPKELPGESVAWKANWQDRFCWAALAFVPSGLLVAFTTYVTTDLASVPLLWVVPLALYLATFIAAFRVDRPIGYRLGLWLQPLAVAITLVTMDWDATFAWALSCIAGTLAFATTSLVCHRQLYERRPATEGLTEFYLWMSIGGAAGGIFAALIAPQVFTSLLEFPVLLGLAVLCRLFLPEKGGAWDWRALLPAIAIALLLVFALAKIAPWNWSQELRLYVLAALGAAAVVSWRRRVAEQAAFAALVLGVALFPNGNAPVHVARSFFGTHKVVEPPGGKFRILMHGLTLHGAQLIDRHPQASQARPLPLTYYHPKGPLAQGLLLARAANADRGGALRVGVVGLGTGAMACHARPGDRWRFFEIDPEVIRIATNLAYFTYLSACRPDAELVLGDARLTLAREAESAFDYLVIDAFSSDAIPVHLLTVEAIRLYVARLSDRGVLALHVSNQNLDLPPTVESSIALIPGLKGIYTEGESGEGAIRSQVILLSRHQEALAPALAWHKARMLDRPAVRPWTDDYSDILSPLVRRYRSKLGG
jgi:hypothetical protein